MEELFNGQLSFADIEAEKFLQIRRTHADRRVNAMDCLTDDVINELIQLCLPLYHIKANHGRPYTRLETMVRVHLLQVSLNLSDLEMESYLASDMVARSFCRVSSTHQFISDSTILRFRHFIEQHGLAQKLLECTEKLLDWGVSMDKLRIISQPFGYQYPLFALNFKTYFLYLYKYLF